MKAARMTDVSSPDGFDVDAFWDVLEPCEDDATMLALLLAKAAHGWTTPEERAAR